MILNPRPKNIQLAEQKSDVVFIESHQRTTRVASLSLAVGQTLQITGVMVSFKILNILLFPLASYNIVVEMLNFFYRSHLHIRLNFKVSFYTYLQIQALRQRNTY